MNWKLFVLASSVGVAGGYLVANSMKKRDLTPEKALSLVKKSVKETYDIDGAWIFLHSEPSIYDGLSHNVYKGGITVQKDSGDLGHYDFAADASSGTIISFQPQ